MDENWAYYTGDTFKFWTGPRPPQNHPKYSDVIAQLQSVYHSYNLIRETAHHYRDALIGQPFNWYLKGTNGEKVEESKTEALIQSWWDWQRHLAVSQNTNQGKPIAEAVTQMLVRGDGNGTGTGYLRLYSPKRYAEASESWKRIVLHCPSPGSVITERDDDGILYKATYCHSKGKEIYTLLDNGQCEVQVQEGKAEKEPYTIDLGGRLPIFELRSSCLFGIDAKQAQNSINKTLTMKSVNNNMAGFLERVILNAQMPGRWEEDPSAPGGERFVTEPGAIEFGANKLAFIQGLPLGDPRNPVGYTNPSIQYREPVGVQTFGDSINIDIACFYRSVGLGHLLVSDDGNLSGISRETVKQDFLTRLEGYSEVVEAALSEVFATVLLLLDEPNYTPVVELKLATGKPLPEERQVNRDDYNAGLRSRTTAMSEAGISDPDAEWELIKRERKEDMKRMPSAPFSSDEFNQKQPQQQQEQEANDAT
jgi:hypothetical protein